MTERLFDIPRDIILPVETVAVRLDRAPHPFETENGEEIDANWARERAANPALFDGAMVLLSRLAYAGRRLEGVCHLIRYATFLHWRRHRSAVAGHTFAHAMLVTTDNALAAVRMGTHTANPGNVYFAAGSFEPMDFTDGFAHVDFNMIREVREETGLDLAPLPRDPIYHVLAAQGGTVIFRRFYLPFASAEAARRIEEHVANDPDPELVGPVIIRNPADLPEGLLPHMLPLIEWHFADSALEDSGFGGAAGPS